MSSIVINCAGANDLAGFIDAPEMRLRRKISAIRNE